METGEAIQLLEEALERLRQPSRNANGRAVQMGGVYWRLAKVLSHHVDPQMDALEGKEHAAYVRQAHGVLVRS